MQKSPRQVIEEKGVAVFAERLGVEAVTVRMWKSRNRFPRSVWPEIASAFPDLHLAALFEVEAAGGAERARKASAPDQNAAA